jgi:hypothetical protein
MSQVLDLREGSDDNGEWPNTASVASLPLSKKRPRDKDESNDDHPRNVKGPQIVKGDHATEKDVDSEDSEQISRRDGSANKNSQKLSISKPPSNASRRQYSVSAWEDRLSELSNYRKTRGHCNVPQNYSENTKLSNWVGHQRCQYRWKLEGKTSSMTLSRIQQLESLGFEWDSRGTTWEDRLIELAAYREIHGHCIVSKGNKAYSTLANWVSTQRSNYKLYRDGKTSPINSLRIQELESMGFDWGVCTTPWGDRLSELAGYRKIHGHCNVPQKYSGNIQLGYWVSTQRRDYRLYVEGKTSPMTLSRMQKLESLSFDWGVCATSWKDRLSELAGYRKIHGHCNVPRNYNKNVKLATWVGNQRAHYRWKLEGKTTWMTLSRIQELDSMGFEWKPSARRGKGAPKKPSLDNDDTRVRKRAVEPPRLQYCGQHTNSKISTHFSTPSSLLQPPGK